MNALNDVDRDRKPLPGEVALLAKRAEARTRVDELRSKLWGTQQLVANAELSLIRLYAENGRFDLLALNKRAILAAEPVMSAYADVVFGGGVPDSR